MQNPLIKTGLMGTATTLIAVGVTMIVNDPMLFGGYFIAGMGIVAMLAKYISTNIDTITEE